MAMTASKADVDDLGFDDTLVADVTEDVRSVNEVEERRSVAEGPAFEVEDWIWDAA